jgi:hypothetical protein
LLRGVSLDHATQWLSTAFQTQRPTIALKSANFPNFAKFANIATHLHDAVQENQDWLQNRIMQNVNRTQFIHHVGGSRVGSQVCANSNSTTTAISSNSSNSTSSSSSTTAASSSSSSSSWRATAEAAVAARAPILLAGVCTGILGAVAAQRSGWVSSL